MEQKRPVYHVDNILRALSPRGRYQMLQLFVGALITIPTGYHLLSYVFTSLDYPTHCAPPANASEFLSPYSDYANVSYSLEECSIHVTSNMTVIVKTSCKFGRSFSKPKDRSAATYYGLVCEKKSLARLSQTLVIAGQGFGAVVSTAISDRYGRKPVFVVSTVALFACGLVIAFSPNYIVYATFKFFTGAFQQGIVTSAVTLMLEVLTITDRRLFSVISGVIWALSNMSIALVSYLMQDFSWQTLQIVFSLTSLIGLFQWWYLDESLRWLIANGKSEEALKILKRAAKTNGKDLETVLQAYQGVDAPHSPNTTDNSKDDPSSPNVEDALAISTKKMTLFDLLRIKRLLVNALAIWFTWFVSALGFFALYLTATSLSGNKYLNFFLTACMELPPTIFYYFFLNKLGRKRTIMFAFAMLSVGLISTGILKSFEETSTLNVVSLLTSLVAMLGASGSFGIVFTYTPELFPTNLRNQALGVASLMGRCGGMLAPFTGVLAEKAKWAPGIFIGGLACIVCLLFTILPETKDKELPQTIEELQAWYSENDKEKEEDTSKTARL